MLLVGGILVTSMLRWIGLAFGGTEKDLRETVPVWLEPEVAALKRASGPFGWLWACLALGFAVLRHLAGEGHGQAPRPAHAECAHAIETAAAPFPAACAEAAPSAGAAWAAKEEKRFTQARCC
jgi:hypothetical protein